MSDETVRLLNGVSMGDDAAIREVAARIDGVSPSQMADVFDERLRFRAAASEFQKQYRDVWEDPHLRRLAESRDAELANLQPELSYSARLQLVGEEIRGWRNKLTAANKPTTKLAYKTPIARDLSQRRASVSTAWDLGDESPDGEESAEDMHAAIDLLAKARGQGRAIR
jgi:hypothetical protein